MIEKLSTWPGFEPGTPGMQNEYSATTPAGLYIHFFENLMVHSSTFYRTTRLYKRQNWSILSKAHNLVTTVNFVKIFLGLSVLIAT